MIVLLSHSMNLSLPPLLISSLLLDNLDVVGYLVLMAWCLSFQISETLYVEKLYHRAGEKQQLATNLITTPASSPLWQLGGRHSAPTHLSPWPPR